MKRILVPATAAVGVALVVAGCGSSGGGSSSTTSPPATSTPKAGAPAGGSGTAVDVKQAAKLGKVLVDSKGRTLYLFEADKGSSSTCFGACASVWPPFTTTGKPKAGSGALASKLGTTKRKDGKTEVTYNGHPLYYYQGDQSAGDTTGQGLNQFGAAWYVLAPSGKKVDKS